MIGNDELSTRLRDLAQIEPRHPDPEDLLALAREVARANRRRGARRRALAVALGVSAAVGGALAAPAAADGIRWLVQTGEFCVGTECGTGDTEFLDLSAPDMPEYVAAQFPENLRLAPGQTRNGLIDQVVRHFDDLAAENSGITTADGVAAAYELQVYCAWADEWLAADDSGDASRREDAAGGLAPGAVPTLYADSETHVWWDRIAAGAVEGARPAVEFAQWQSCGAPQTEAAAQWAEE